MTPAVLAALLSSVVVLSLAGRTFQSAGSAAGWWGAWVLAAGFCGLASFRSALPAVPGRGGGVLWLVAGAFGGGLLGRHALVAWMSSWTEFSVDAATIPGLTLGDMVLLVALLVPSIVIALASRLRSPRPALLLPALFGLVPLVLLAAPEFVDGLPTPKSRPDPRLGVSSLAVVAALLWATTLPGPAALPLSTRRPWMHHWLPRLLSMAVLIGLPGVLLVGSQLSHSTEVVALGDLGRRVFGRYGSEVGAGIECLLTLVALHVLLVLCARVAARSLPRLRSGVFPGLALAAGLLAAWAPPNVLITCSALAGWIAVLWGVEPDGAAPPSPIEGDR